VQATLERPVLRRRRSFAIRRHGTAHAARTRTAGLIGWIWSALVNAGARLRRPVLYLGSMAAVCHGAWQIWAPLGWFTLALCGVVVEMLTGPSGDEG